jgi:hypothetical protein
VRQSVKIGRSVCAENLRQTVDTARIYRMLEDGTIGNERARWLPSFLEGKSKVGSYLWQSGT